MALIWTRVDQKLMHGQVALAWVPYLDIDTLVIADQDITGDDLSQKIMKMGLPPEVQSLFFTSPGRLVEILSEEFLTGRRILLLFKNLEGFFTAAETGFKPTKVNLGNQALETPGPAGIRLTDTFYATGPDLARLEALQRQGLDIILQTVPAGKAIHWKPDQELTPPGSAR